MKLCSVAPSPHPEAGPLAKTKCVSELAIKDMEEARGWESW